VGWNLCHRDNSLWPGTHNAILVEQTPTTRARPTLECGSVCCQTSSTPLARSATLPNSTPYVYTYTHTCPGQNTYIDLPRSTYTHISRPAQVNIHTHTQSRCTQVNIIHIHKQTCPGQHSNNPLCHRRVIQGSLQV
jgi:hypothetical protein